MLERASGLDPRRPRRELDQAAPERGAAWCRAMVERRVAGEPLQYVLGVWAFRSLELLVDPRVLIPRPETEQVVEAARAELARLRRNRPEPAGSEPAGSGPAGSGPAGSGLVAVDLGTGSGAIALALAAEEPGLAVWATDVSAGALAVARSNLAGMGGRGATRVRLAEGSWYQALPAELAGRVDLVVSNPPYVAEAELAGLPEEVAGWEPTGALVSGPSGREAIADVLGGAGPWLARPGSVVVELAPHQASAAAALAEGAGLVNVEIRPDLAGRPRVLVARVR